ncbi:MAG: RsmB/NOP family class I SAM-dependent RNA methyltransferase [Firmicutes bacterium]|nr:RsmB/NOP family class I SAM-dependent RNA methyltransferase [Bacillota bacterium]
MGRKGRSSDEVFGELFEAVAACYEPHDLFRIRAGFRARRPVTLRANTIKTDIRRVMEVLRRDGFKFNRVPWYEEALILPETRERDLEVHGLYREGHIYLQSLSSMLPPLVMRPRPGWRVLDLAAAPGSKTTQLAALMGNTGYILANEINPLRAARLKFNLERQGAGIVEVRLGDGKRLGEEWDGSFDAVLLDAPCSGTGLVVEKDPSTWRSWSPELVAHLVKEQKKLMAAAFRALKPGGILVYATCTLLREENEGVVRWTLENYRGRLFLERIDLALSGAEVAAPEPIPGHGREGMLLLLPSKLYEGFFLARLRKKA